MLQKIRRDLIEDPSSHRAFTLEHNHLHYKERLVLSAQSTLIPKLIAEFHVTATRGHSKVFKTYRKVAQLLYWVWMKKVVTDFVTA